MIYKIRGCPCIFFVLCEKIAKARLKRCYILQILLICFFLLLSIVLLMDIQLEILLSIGDKSTNSYFAIKVFKGLFTFKYKLFKSTQTNKNKIQKKNKHKDFFKKIHKYIKLLRKHSHTLKKCLIYILKRLKFNKIYIDSMIGTGDPMSTSLLTGTISTFLFNGLTYLGRFSKINTHRLIVRPEFAKTIFKVKFHCIIQIKLGYIIIAALIAAKQIIRR
mgnify:CR=1 FL=1